MWKLAANGAWTQGAKVSPHYKHEGEDGDMKYLMKCTCICYGEKYSLKELYKKCTFHKGSAV